MNYFTKALKTLGLKSLTSKKELKKAYYEKSKKCHPDNGGNGVQFIELNNCYQYLNSKFAKKYIINFGIDDIVSNKNFDINEHIKIQLTPANIKSKIIRFKYNNKKFSVKLKYKDSKEYPLSVEDNKVYINIYKQIGIQEFLNNKVVFNIGSKTLMACGIPNKGKLEVTNQLHDNFYVRVSFEIWRSEREMRITAEDMKGVCNVK